MDKILKYFPHLTEDQIKTLRIVDNRVAKSKTDMEMLAEEGDKKAEENTGSAEPEMITIKSICPGITILSEEWMQSLAGNSLQSGRQTE